MKVNCFSHMAASRVAVPGVPGCIWQSRLLPHRVLITELLEKGWGGQQRPQTCSGTLKNEDCL